MPRPTADQVKTAQQQLHAAGLYNGPSDGMMDPDTRAALARYQQQNGLRRTETLDPRTIAQLDSGQTTGYGSSTPTTTPAPAGAGGDTAAPSTTPAATVAGGNTTAPAPTK
ncbi:MAG: peptidoglycan-binding domain-containing protein [Alphaproteobacteria bacterium]